jgi:putative peptidoglycan lipid II flippase
MIRLLKNCFVNGEKSSSSITRSAALIAVMGMASRILGLVRDRILASKFGAGDTLDAYYAAFKIPDLIYGLLVLGALSAAFVPVFTSLVSRKKDQEAWKLVQVILSVGTLILATISLLLFLFAPGIVSLITFGYTPEKQALVTELTRIMLLSPILLGISGILGGVLNSFKKFFFYSLAPLFYNVGIIIGAVFFTESFGPVGLAFGVVLGAALHLLIQVPEVIRCGMKFGISFDFKNKQLRRVFTLMIPRAMGLAVTQMNLLVVTVLASTLASGSLAIFNFANNLQSVPMGLFGISFAVASFPTLSCLWAQQDKEEFVKKFIGTLRKILFFIVPLSALIIVLRAQIVRVVLGSGRFDWNDTHLTFTALGVFAFSLWAQSVIPLLARSFYAVHDTKVPFLTGVSAEIVNIALALFLIKDHGIIGLVWAFSVSTSLNAVLLFLILRAKIGSMKGQGLTKFGIKLILMTIVAVGVAQTIKSLISADPFGAERTFLGVFTQLMVALTGGVGAMLFVGHWLKIKELNHFVDIAKKKIFSRKPLPEEQRDEVGGV